MREILFRGKRLDNVDWVEGYYIKKTDPFLPGIEKDVIVTFDENSMSVWNLVDHKTVGQYVGTDKNGKRIFEGDILLFCFEEIGPQKAVVEWSQKYMMFKLSPTGNFQYARPVDGEVIGNIYDNQPGGGIHAQPRRFRRSGVRLLL